MNRTQTLSHGVHHRRDTCRGCLSTRLTSFLDYGAVPLAGDFLLPEQVGVEKVYPMDLRVCQDCWLTQISNVVNADELFTDYRYLSSVTKTLMGHFVDYAETIQSRLLTSPDDLVVEFGCNDGVLLSPLVERGVRAIGIDAAANVVEIARAKGLVVENGYFGAESAGRLLSTHGEAKVITASNVFAHIDDMDDVMRGVDTLLALGGVLSVEVHYVADLLQQAQFETVYHEHLCYYSLLALQSLYERFGFVLVDAERLPMHGGAIRVFAQRSDENGEPSDRLLRLLAEERARGLATLAPYQDFGRQAQRQRDAIRAFVAERKAMGRSISGYGAAGRATTLLNYCGIDAQSLDYIVDESPSRIGRYVPGVGLPIVPRSHFHKNPTDDCLLTAWNYRDEIVAKEQEFLNGGGCFLAPLPELEVIQRREPCLNSA